MYQTWASINKSRRSLCHFDNFYPIYFLRRYATNTLADNEIRPVHKGNKFEGKGKLFGTFDGVSHQHCLQFWGCCN